MREDYVESIFKFKGQSRPSQQDARPAESHRRNARGIVALLNRIEHFMLYMPAAAETRRAFSKIMTTQIGFLDSRDQGDLLPACEPLAATVNRL